MFKHLSITDIFFDLDHTLWDFEKNSALAFHKVFEAHQLQIDIPLFLLNYEPINMQYWKLYRDEHITKQQLRRGRLYDAFAKLGMTFPLETIDSFAKVYIETLPLNNYLFPGTIELLEYLKPNYKLHIITNGFEEVQNLKLRNSKIESYFQTVTNSERVGVKKPNPVIFQFALNQANSTPEKSVMIGDNIEADILGAKAVGMHTLLFSNNHKSNNNFIVAKQHLDIKNLF